MMDNQWLMKGCRLEFYQVGSRVGSTDIIAGTFMITLQQKFGRKMESLLLFITDIFHYSSNPARGHRHRNTCTMANPWRVITPKTLSQDMPSFVTGNYS